LFAHDLFGEPLHTFPDHALGSRIGHERGSSAIASVLAEMLKTMMREAAS
jgi:hypothetical protein